MNPLTVGFPLTALRLELLDGWLPSLKETQFEAPVTAVSVRSPANSRAKRDMACRNVCQQY